MTVSAPLPFRHLCAILCHIALFCALLTNAFGQEAPEGELPYFQIDGKPASIERLPLKSVDASIEIVGTLAQVELVQTYANVGTEAIEAVYVFPGSNRAAVSSLEIRVGDRLVKAVIQEKVKAQQTYDAAKAEGKTASLLVQHRPNVFQMNLANILPGDVIEVTLCYTEWVVREKSEYRFSLPLVVGPRFSEEPAQWIANPHLSGEDMGSVQYSITSRIRSALTLEQAVCDSHEAEIVFEDTRTASLRVEGDAQSVGNRDFLLRYQISGDDVKSGLWVSESDGEKYFMASIEPPVMGNTRKRMPREYFFIVDVSGSMSGFPLDTAKLFMERLVARLDEGDRFNLMLFAGESAVFSDKPVSATVDNLLAVIEFLHETRGSGGTRLQLAMQRAYAMPRDRAFSRAIVVLTDGYVTVEERVFDLIRENLDESSVFACGIGSSPNRHLIEGMARVGLGEAFFVSQPNEADLVADRFSEYVSKPVLSQLSMSFEGMEAFDVEPASLPDLLAERPVVVFGKYHGALAGGITLTGRSGDSEYSETVRMTDAVNMGGSRSLEYVWAREKIRRISDYASFWPNEDRVQQVTELGLKHSLLTKYTSFVAVDEVVRVAEGGRAERVLQPTVTPKGMATAQFSGGQSVPVTPEPEMWALMGLVFVAVTWILIRRGV